MAKSIIKVLFCFPLFIYLLNAFSFGFPKKSCAEWRAKASQECVDVRMRVYYIFHALWKWQIISENNIYAFTIRWCVSREFSLREEKNDLRCDIIKMCSTSAGAVEALWISIQKEAVTAGKIDLKRSQLEIMVKWNDIEGYCCWQIILYSFLCFPIFSRLLKVNFSLNFYFQWLCGQKSTVF